MICVVLVALATMYLATSAFALQIAEALFVPVAVVVLCLGCVDLWRGRRERRH